MEGAVLDREYTLLNRYQNTQTGLYSGVPVMTLLANAGVDLAFVGNLTFISYDGYTSPNMSAATLQGAAPEMIIVAFEANGQSMDRVDEDGEGPLRCVVDLSVYPTWNSLYWVKGLTAIQLV
jgi:hypothetical protein